MKNTLLILVLSLAAVRVAAQTGLHIGFFGGPQYTMMINDEPIVAGEKGFKYVPTFGKTGTLKFGYNFVPPIGIAVAATYSLQGQDYKSQDSLGEENYTSRRNTYIKVPILLHLSSTPGPVMFVMEVGPQFALNRTATMSVDDTPVSMVSPTKLMLKSTDIQVAWAMGVEFGLSPGVHIVVQHRGDYGAFDCENKALSENQSLFYPAERKKTNNLTASIVAGMEFVLKGAHSKTTRHFKGRTWRNNWR